MHYKKSFIAASSITLWLTACNVGPHYTAPTPDVPATWLSENSPAIDPRAAIEHAWWQHFQDPVLNTIITKALAGNIDFKIAQVRIEEARASRALSEQALLPQGDVSAQAIREANRFAFGNIPFDIKKPFNSYTAGFDASWELDLFGANRHALASATAQLHAAQADRDSARVSLLAEVARTYVDIRHYQQELAIVENTIVADKDTLRIATERGNAGTSPLLDAVQAQAQLHQVESELPYYRNLLAQAEFTMDVLLGEKPGAAHAITAVIAPIPVPDKALVLNAPSTVIANRPDIRSAEERLASATEQQGVARAKWFPDISLAAFLGILSPETNNLFTADSKSWDGSANVLWPILSYKQLEANSEHAEAAQKEAMLTYQKSVLTALSDVESSITAYTQEEAHRAALQLTLQDDRHALSIARERYKAGLSSFIDVLDAERTVYTAESDLTGSDALTTTQLIAVYKSLGGGWKEEKSN